MFCLGFKYVLAPYIYPSEQRMEKCGKIVSSHSDVMNPPDLSRSFMSGTPPDASVCSTTALAGLWIKAEAAASPQDARLSVKSTMRPGLTGFAG